MKLSDVLERFRDGDEHGWDVEFAFLRQHHADQLLRLRQDVEANGITTPILLGPDRRIWDGHHRLCVAAELGLEYVPTERA